MIDKKLLERCREFAVNVVNGEPESNYEATEQIRHELISDLDVAISEQKVVEVEIEILRPGQYYQLWIDGEEFGSIESWDGAQRKARSLDGATLRFEEEK